MNGMEWKWSMERPDIRFCLTPFEKCISWSLKLWSIILLIIIGIPLNWSWLIMWIIIFKAGLDYWFKVAAIFCVLLPEWKMKIMAETKFLHEETMIWLESSYERKSGCINLDESVECHVILSCHVMCLLISLSIHCNVALKMSRWKQ